MKISPRCTHISAGRQCPDSAGYLVREHNGRLSPLLKYCRKHANANTRVGCEPLSLRDVQLRLG